ncbi:MAG: hypothetical protein DMG88_20140 [Acidobacteria bacterium]|nr:MAG: hypothetical protein DMG88_20140 [Acidobacteriota bacterium]
MKRTRGRHWLYALVAVMIGAILLPAQVRPQDKSRSEAVFKQLVSLVGERKQFRTVFRLQRLTR